MHNNCDFEVLLSCMGQQGFDIAYKSKIDSNLLIINQCDKDDYHEIEVNGHLWRMIDTTERGLSKSRNMAIRNAKGRILLFADDDETMADGYETIIVNAFKELPNATMIAFNLHRINVKMKKSYYKITTTKLSNRNFGSPMTACLRDKIIENNIYLNEMFGSGSQWGGGEDCILQQDIRRKGLHIYEYPAEIATIDYSNESKWFHGYTEELFYNQGAFNEYCNSSKIYRFLYGVYFCFWKLRKEKDLSPFEKMKWRHIGAKGWKYKVTYSEYVANGNRYKTKQ